MYSKLQYISNGNTFEDQLISIQNALDSGCDWIQMRFKSSNEIAVMKLAEETKTLCSLYRATFIVNDFIKVAKKVDADGVHLGLKDHSIETSRLILEPNKIVGGTANTFADVQSRIVSGCDYIGLGPFRYTATKSNLSPILGLEGYESILNKLNELNISIPIYAIGGITQDDIEDIMNTGIHGIAVSGLITNCHFPKQTVEQLKNLLYVVS